ncbi:hypothetical protein UFOVP714_44 [uncultured Caudovirales phage]|uniref:Bacteriophage P22, Gp10, DNA-stabilising n=1 Tax=uncultured Caudovirales phage TaxID=2100421 RepID=A0A6J5NP65_9CAUD|nr:hypothetical protein UFOVP714_44 [uncultured Caudovirales phage]CAB4167381.1 hypothetical protein UFOVP864_16 [uncultured Caudovirales phage]
MAEQIVQIMSKPGIKRDGTKFEGDQYVDGQWVRFQRGLPRKIGGYRSINKFLRGLPRALHEYTQDLLTYVHAGSADRLERFFIDATYNTSVITDRTPSSGFTADDGNMWQFATAYDTTNGNQIVAQVAPNLGCICNSDGGALFVGDLLGTSVLTEVTTVPANFSVTGGVVTLPPYTFAFGNDGYAAWSVPNDPADFTSSGAGNAYITGQKIVKGMPLRGGPGNSPSGLFWSADSLIRGTYVGGTAVFQFDTISTQSSILAANSVIEYDGIFYWIGTDRFLMFNGVVREVENNLNLNFFFDNLNYAQRQKVFAYKVPRFGEIWWCFPFGDSIEPNHAVIYNVRENTWYDTELPNGGRGAGLFPAVFSKPLLSGVAPQEAEAVTAAVVAGGTGYAVGNTLTVVGGLGQLDTELTVTTIGGSGAITGVSISNAGQYVEIPTNPVSVTGGAGSAATFNLTFDNPYKFWVHEVGTDEIDGLTLNPIQSFFETADLSLPVSSQVNKSLQALMIEPDFVQSGDMTVQVMGRANARAPEVNGIIMTFVEDPQTPQEQVVFLKTQRRELRFRFESNTLGGNYQMGLVLAHVQPGDGTVLG